MTEYGGTVHDDHDLYVEALLACLPDGWTLLSWGTEDG